MALHPASMTFHAFFGPTPPSISIQGSTPFALHMAFSSLILSTWDSMKLWPPKPGFTDMISTRSTSSMTYSSTERGVPGFSTTPAMQPSCLIWFKVRWRWIVEAASACTEMMSAPAFAKSSTRVSGSTIMRWQSITASGSFFLSASTTRGPMVILGTKRPSMTSTCTQSAPALITSATSSPSLEKSADRMEGEIFTDLASLRNFSTRGFVARNATARAGAGAPRRAAVPRRRVTAAPKAAAPTSAAPAANTPSDVLRGAAAVATTTASPCGEATATGEARRCCGGLWTKAVAQPKVTGRRKAFGDMAGTRGA
mmetsp:Transcript_114111/g.243356  ORF Transcript_114111/g.243356 Transcript_114111/m.243356 type:complete len:312 (-) Transcript_114111:50-985(-)